MSTKNKPIPSKILANDGIECRVATNGVFVITRRYGGDPGCYSPSETAVFREPEEFGKWCADWMRSHFVKKP